MTIPPEPTPTEALAEPLLPSAPPDGDTTGSPVVELADPNEIIEVHQGTI